MFKKTYAFQIPVGKRFLNTYTLLRTMAFLIFITILSTYESATAFSINEPEGAEEIIFAAHQHVVRECRYKNLSNYAWDESKMPYWCSFWWQPKLTARINDPTP
jgi:hypothetical protein